MSGFYYFFILQHSIFSDLLYISLMHFVLSIDQWCWIVVCQETGSVDHTVEYWVSRLFLQTSCWTPCLMPVWIFKRMKAVESKDLNLWPVESWKFHILQLVYLNISIPALGYPVTICHLCVCCRCLEVSDWQGARGPFKRPPEAAVLCR